MNLMVKIRVKLASLAAALSTCAVSANASRGVGKPARIMINSIR